jgi:hypothetical protein
MAGPNGKATAGMERGTQEEIEGTQTLARHLANRPDEEIIAKVVEQGADTLLDRIFWGMETRFQPDRFDFDSEESVAQWVIYWDDDVREYTVRCTSVSCMTRRGADPQAFAVLSMALPDFLRFLAFRQEGVDAYMDGTLEVEGDLMYAESMEQWFRRD